RPGTPTRDTRRARDDRLMTTTLPPPIGVEPVAEPPAPGAARAGKFGHGQRLVGPDAVRGLALIGVVVMNYHGYLIIAGGERSKNWMGRFFAPWEGPLSTRFAATFVITA